MNETTNPIDLASGFAAPTLEQWRQLVDKALKGADFDKKLVAKTADGLRIEPLYTRADTLPGAAGAAPGKAPFTRGTHAYTQDLGWQIHQRVLEADQVLVGRNATRRAYNMRMRERRGFTDPMPEAGDKLVCLRNNRKKGLFNGGLWTVKERGQRKGGTKTGIMSLRLLPDDETATRGVKVSVRPECFTGGIEQLDWSRRKPYDEFDYGYVLTVHKAQGSQWDDVVLFDESFAFQDSRERWLYTGITRAAKRLTVVM